MQIGNNEPLSQSQINSARRVVSEFGEVAQKMIGADNQDTVDLDSSKGKVEVDFIGLGKNERGKYSGSVTYDPQTSEVKELFVTRNYDKKDGVGVNYALHSHEDNTVSYRRDDMYQEFPMCRSIEEVVVDKGTGEIKSYEAYEERDDYMPPMGGGDSDYYLFGNP
ncbi:MAG: hypothetical protein RDV48_25885 [Candidatus Eremiobacteraeota bacterium]|nr:hypothetical protein [Candidatus Eremiobacteraeota bacterium]